MKPLATTGFALLGTCLIAISYGLARFAFGPGQLFFAVISAAVFGIAYMSLTGLYLLSGIRLLPGRLSVGPVLPFIAIAIAIGQAVGSPAMGLAIKHLDYAHAFAFFSIVGLFAATLSPLYPRHLDYGEDADGDAEPEEITQPAAEGVHTQ